MQLDGLAELERELERRLQAIAAHADRAMGENALHLAGESARRAPIDSGDLRGAHDVRRLDAGSYEVGVYSATLDNPIYPIVQHERLDFRHPKGGQAKFLESAFAEHTERYLAHVADAVRKAR